MNKILENIKHLPSTLAGGVIAGTGLLLTYTNNPLLQQLASVNPQAAKYFTAIAGIAGGLGLILGVGPKK